MKMLSEAGRLFRVEEWYDSKVPMLILPALYSVAVIRGGEVQGYLKYMLLLLCFDSIFLAFGYLVNDYADIDVDKKAGKKKVMHHLPGQIPLLLVIASGAAGCLEVLFISHSPLVIVALSVIYFFGASYSMPPLRFKERGIWGLLVSSSAQRCFPLLLLPVLLEIPVDRSYVLWMILSFFVGIRYILVHQYIDGENDKKSGVDTFALRHQRKVTILINLSFVTELALLAVLMIPAFEKSPWILVFFSGYFWLSLIRWRGCRMVFGQGGLYSFDQVPLEDLYNHFLPLVFVIMLMQRDLRWGVLLIIWGIFLLRPLIGHLRFPVKILADRLKKQIQEG